MKTTIKKRKPPAGEKPVWFITGCSTGFGRELAKQVLELGYRVVVTARRPAANSALSWLVVGVDVPARCWYIRNGKSTQ